MTRRQLLGFVAGLVILVAVQWTRRGEAPYPPGAALPSGGADPVAIAYEARQRDVPIDGRGVVTRILKDDREGSRHQRFLLRTATGISVLVAHNIDLAPRLAPLEVGDTVRFVGEYVWNEQGGVVHWTHRDPAGRHPGGRLEVDGRTVQ